MNTCPHCAATMSIVTVGELRDKRLRCAYCRSEVDIPDTYSATEEHRSPDGGFTYRKTVTRMDLAAPGSTPTTPPDGAPRRIEVEGLDQLQALLGQRSVQVPDDVRSLLEDLAEKGMIQSVRASTTTRAVVDGQQQVDTATRFEYRIPASPGRKKTSLSSKILYALAWLTVAWGLLILFERLGLLLVTGMAVGQVWWWERRYPEE